MRMVVIVAAQPTVKTSYSLLILAVLYALDRGCTVQRHKLFVIQKTNGVDLHIKVLRSFRMKKFTLRYEY